MTHIIMTQTRKGSNNGFTVNEYYKDNAYEVTHSLACYFLQKGYAKIEPYNDILQEIKRIKSTETGYMRNLFLQWVTERIQNCDLEACKKDQLLKEVLFNGGDDVQ